MGEVRGALLADGGWGTEAQLVTTVVPWMRVRVLPKHHLHETLETSHNPPFVRPTPPLGGVDGAQRVGRDVHVDGQVGARRVPVLYCADHRGQQLQLSLMLDDASHNPALY